MRTPLIVADHPVHRYLPHLFQVFNKESIQDFILINLIDAYNISILILCTRQHIAQGNAKNETGSPEYKTSRPGICDV